jgi:hypothetical protein
MRGRLVEHSHGCGSLFILTWCAAVSEEKNTAAAAAAAPDVAEDKSEKNAEKKGENIREGREREKKAKKKKKCFFLPFQSTHSSQ